MTGLWLKNIKKFATGATVGSSQCLQVSVENTVPVPVTAANYAYKERRFHLPASKTINKRTGAWIQLDVNTDAASNTPADIANTIVEMRVSWNGGSALEIGKGANAGVVTVLAAIGAGQSTAVGGAMVSGDKIWVRALQDVDVVSGELLISLMG